MGFLHHFQYSLLKESELETYEALSQESVCGAKVACQRGQELSKALLVIPGF